MVLDQEPSSHSPQEICLCPLGEDYCPVPKDPAWNFKALCQQNDFRKGSWLCNEEKGEKLYCLTKYTGNLVILDMGHHTEAMVNPGMGSNDQI